MSTAREAPPDMEPDSELRVLITAKGLDASGGVVNYVASLMSQFPAPVRAEHLQVGREPQQRRLGRDLLFPLLDNFALARRVRTVRPHCVHLNPSFNAKAMLRDGALLLTLRAIGQRNVVVFFHGWDEALAARVARSGWRRRLFCWVFGWPPLTFVLASSFRNTLLQIGLEPRRVRVTTTMFDGSLFSDLRRSRSDDGETRLVFMSRFVAEKGIHELLQAFVRLAEEFPGLRLVLLGDGPERPALEARAQEAGLAERVDFAGYVRGHEKAQALVDADIFVFPTYYGEGCPVVLLEAMAAGLPVITHGAGGIPDVFEDGRNGILLSTVTGESVADAVRRMLTAPEVRSAIGAHNRREAWARYEAGVVSGQMVEAYQELT